MEDQPHSYVNLLQAEHVIISFQQFLEGDHLHRIYKIPAVHRSSKKNIISHFSYFFIPRH